VNSRCVSGVPDSGAIFIIPTATSSFRGAVLRCKALNEDGDERSLDDETMRNLRQQ
jgi:hypothetical protein